MRLFERRLDVDEDVLTALRERAEATTLRNLVAVMRLAQRMHQASYATANSGIEEIEIAEHSGEAFSIAADVDMTAVELRDIISDKPITRSRLAAHLRPPAVAMSSTTETVSWSYEA